MTNVDRPVYYCNIDSFNNEGFDMLPITYNCKKCPAQEAKTVCPTTAKKSAEKQIESRKVNPALKVSQLKSPELTDSQASLALNNQQNKFFAPKLDDRSTHLDPRAKFHAFILVPLLAFHVLSQTPGVGSSKAALSEFVITEGALKIAPAPALQIS